MPTDNSVSERLGALEASAQRLASLVNGLKLEQLDQQAYPSKWSVADVLSHLGSGAVIMQRGIDAAVSGHPVEEGFTQSVWDLWNAKGAAAKATDALAADRALLDRVASLTDAERDSFHYAFGPFQADLATFLGLRLNEHVLHSWDIDVALHPTATLPPDAVAIVIDNLETIAGFAGKSDGHDRDLTVHTTEPSRAFTVKVDLERVTLSAAEPAAPVDAELPSEAFVRLIYGRLDPDHSPPDIESPVLEQLRGLFPGL
jgi:uncharacterized protein (TIGR03083 family)